MVDSKVLPDLEYAQNPIRTTRNPLGTGRFRSESARKLVSARKTWGTEKYCFFHILLRPMVILCCCIRLMFRGAAVACHSARLWLRPWLTKVRSAVFSPSCLLTVIMMDNAECSTSRIQDVEEEQLHHRENLDITKKAEFLEWLFRRQSLALVSIWTQNNSGPSTMKTSILALVQWQGIIVGSS